MSTAKGTHWASILLILALLCTSTSCKKYEEGPLISISSKKKRLSQTWFVKLVEDTDTGEEITGSYATMRWKFAEDGVFTETYDTLPSSSGGWNFIREKESIQITIPGDQTDIRNYKIVRLAKKQLKVSRGNELFSLTP